MVGWFCFSDRVGQAAEEAGEFALPGTGAVTPQGANSDQAEGARVFRAACRAANAPSRPAPGEPGCDPSFNNAQAGSFTPNFSLGLPTI